MAKVTYIGPSREVTVPKARKIFTRGKSSECPDEVALGLSPDAWELPADIRKKQEESGKNAVAGPGTATQSAPPSGGSPDTKQGAKAPQNKPQAQGGGK